MAPGRPWPLVGADAVGQRDQIWLYSVGALVPASKFSVLEARTNFSDTGENASVTVKADVIFSF